MILPKLYQRLLRNSDPGVDGGAAPAAVPAEPSAAPTPAAEPAAPAASPAPAEPDDRFGDLRAMFDRIGQDPAATPSAPAQPRDPLGRFAPVTTAPATTAATPAAPAAAPAPNAAAPAGDDLTPPEGMSERAQARWASLTERAKLVPQLEQQAQEARTALDSVRQLVSESGLQPAEFTELLDVVKASRSANPQEVQRALQYIDGIRTDLALRAGVDLTQQDVLAGHPDLQQKVQNMLMTREDALEIARLRVHNQRATATTQQFQERQQFQQTVQSAAASMESALAQRAMLPGHQAKVQAIHAHFTNPANLQQFVSTYEPRQWSAAVQWMYDHMAVPAPVAPPAAAAPAAPAVPQPLRPGNARSGTPQASGPMTAETALQSAFASIGM